MDRRASGVVVRPHRRWASASFALATSASLLLLVVPSYSGSECESTFHGPTATTHCSSTHATLIEENGTVGVLILLAVPVVLTAGGLIASRCARTGAAVLLCMFVLITGFSIGAAYLPCAFAAVLAARRTPRRGRRRCRPIGPAAPS